MEESSFFVRACSPPIVLNSCCGCSFKAAAFGSQDGAQQGFRLVSSPLTQVDAKGLMCLIAAAPPA